MLEVSPELLNHLNNGHEFRTIELYQIFLVGGAELLLTNHDRYYQGYAPAVIERSLLKRKRGLEVQELELTWTPGNADLVFGYPALEAAMRGAFDEARVQATVVFMSDDWQTAVGSVLLYSGWVAQVRMSDWTIYLTAKNIAHQLTRQVPRGLYTAGCQWRVYDANCDLNRALFGTEAVVVNQAGRNVELEDIFGKPDHWYDLGMLSSGGQVYNILRQTGTTLILLEEPLNPLGASVMIYPGCDLTKDHCQNKFNNFSRYRGFMFIPEPEVAMFGAATTAGPIANLPGAQK